jgi:hypothetical protein
MVPVERAELVTGDMDLVAELIRDLYIKHAASFRCPDPAAVDGRIRSATAGGLNASLLCYGGFAYSAVMEPVNPPMAVVCTAGSGTCATGREQVRLAPREVFLLPAISRASCPVSTVRTRRCRSRGPRWARWPGR